MDCADYKDFLTKAPFWPAGAAAPQSSVALYGRSPNRRFPSRQFPVVSSQTLRWR